MKALSQITSNGALIDSTLHAQNSPPLTPPGRGDTPLPAHLVGAETLLGVVGELVADVDQVVVGVDVVQAVGLGLAGRLAHVLAVAEQAVEVELVGVLAVGGQAGVAANEWGKRKGMRKSDKPRREEDGRTEGRTRLPYFSWNCRKPGLTWGLAFSREVVASGELAGRLGMEAGI